MTPQQRAQYLPVMKALLKVMETKYPAAQDINTLMILTRDLSKQVPKVGTDQTFGSAELLRFGSAQITELFSLLNTGFFKMASFNFLGTKSFG